MIHWFNVVLIICVSIFLYYTLFKKEGFRVNKLNKIPNRNIKQIPHLPDDIVAWVAEKIGAPSDPHNPDYIMEEEECDA